MRVREVTPTGRCRRRRQRETTVKLRPVDRGRRRFSAWGEAGDRVPTRSQHASTTRSVLTKSHTCAVMVPLISSGRRRLRTGSTQRREGVCASRLSRAIDSLRKDCRGCRICRARRGSFDWVDYEALVAAATPISARLQWRARLLPSTTRGHDVTPKASLSRTAMRG